MRHAGTNARIAAAGDGGLSRRDFARVARFLSDHVGIVMSPAKHTLMEGRLRRRLRATGQPSLAAYCDYVFSAEGQAREAVHLIDALTTNKTDFFREPEHFDALVRDIIPAILKSATRPRTIKIWSAACSIGAEAYTIAMVTAHALREHSGWRLQLLGTDISTDVLGTAADGIYAEAMIAPVPMHLRQAFVLRHRDRGRGLVRVAPQLRALLRLERLNLMQESYPVDRDFDVVFCRNVLIYFDRDMQVKVAKRLAAHLRPGGTLVLGHSEASAGIGALLRATSNTMFQVP